MQKRIILLLFVFSVFACQQNATSDWVAHDLLENGIPITIEGPDSIKVKVTDALGVLQDITVDSPDDNYHLQIYASQAETDDIALIKADLISDVRNNPFFTKVVEEDESGFVYEMIIDSTNYYSFRHVHVQGDQEFIFQPGIANTFQLAEAMRLREAVRQK
jgi:hypothetical protein